MADTNDNDEIIFPQDELEDDSPVEEVEATEEVLEEVVTEPDPVEEMEKKYMALYAEYENFRKRTAREKDKLYQDAVADVTSQWLVLLDNITRAVASTKNADENSIESIVAGMELLQKQADDILEKIGVKEIEAERGTKFDPNLHEAVMHIEDPDLGEQEIAQVFQKGFIYKDQVIRHSVVQVAN